MNPDYIILALFLLLIVSFVVWVSHELYKIQKEENAKVADEKLHTIPRSYRDLGCDSVLYFEPKEDMTVYEYAVISSKITNFTKGYTETYASSTSYDQLPECVKRHLRIEKDERYNIQPIIEAE